MRKEKIVVFTGAGISAESGLGTFRDEGGLWEKFDINEVATPEAWKANPVMVTDFYNQRRKQCYEAAPNAAHFALAQLEEKYSVEIITQNIDNLHERAGSSAVTHLHGEISKVKSSGPQAENKKYHQENWEVKIGDVCPDGYQLRPHVVWFGEAVPMLDKATAQIEEASIVIVVGTSLNVYPAAGILEYAPDNAHFYIVDPGEVSVPKQYTVIKDTAVSGVTKVVEKLM